MVRVGPPLRPIWQLCLLVHYHGNRSLRCSCEPEHNVCALQLLSEADRIQTYFAMRELPPGDDDAPLGSGSFGTSATARQAAAYSAA